MTKPKPKAKPKKSIPPTELQTQMRELAKNWPEEDTNLVAVKCTGIERSIPAGSTHEDALKALEYCAQARRFGETGKGALFLMQAQAALKDFELYDSYITAQKSKHGYLNRRDTIQKQKFIPIVQKLNNEMTNPPTTLKGWLALPELRPFAAGYPTGHTLRDWIVLAGITLKSGRPTKT